MQLSVLHWNVGRSRTNAALALEQRQEDDVIVITEPGRRVICSSAGKYHVIHKGGSAAIYILKRHSPASWSHDGQGDWCSVRFQEEGAGRTTVVAVYVLAEKGDGWISPIPELAAMPAPGRCVVVGDMNLHHPA